mmetsp:Transcript_57675/g.148374  ORF Transcript_57675/g.148374 Transcript_57675/m.148374 type:complete len:265 (+) Transcript_57675:164-958(+)
MQGDTAQQGGSQPEASVANHVIWGAVILSGSSSSDDRTSPSHSLDIGETNDSKASKRQDWQIQVGGTSMSATPQRVRQLARKTKPGVASSSGAKPTTAAAASKSADVAASSTSTSSTTGGPSPALNSSAIAKRMMKIEQMQQQISDGVVFEVLSEDTEDTSSGSDYDPGNGAAGAAGDDRYKRLGEISEGSRLHDLGQCKPCAWHWKRVGCKSGEACLFCHTCEIGTLKVRRKEKIATLRAESAAVAASNQAKPVRPGRQLLSL